MKRNLYPLCCLVVVVFMACVSLSRCHAQQAQDGPKAPAEKPAEVQAAKQAGQDDLPARIQKLEQAVRRLEGNLGSRPLPPPNSMGIAIMAQTFAIIGMGVGAMAFIRAIQLSKQLEQLRVDRDQSKSTETPGRTNG